MNEMNEGWMGDLKRLGGMEPPEELWRRIQERMEHASSPSSRGGMRTLGSGRRWVEAGIALVIAVLGMSLAVVALRDVAEERPGTAAVRNGVIAYVGGSGPGAPGIWTVGPDSDPEELVSDLSVSLARWSPDGRRIAFNARAKGGDKGIFVADSGGRILLDVREKFPEIKGYQSAPVWAPDSRRLAFVQVESPSGDLDIYVTDADGSSPPRRLLSTPAWRTSPAWSPDGTWIAFAQRDGPGDLNVYVVRPDGRGLRRLTNDRGFEFEPAFSPDGSRLVFLHADGRRRELHAIGLDGSERETLLAGESQLGPTLAWSPDGDAILVEVLEEGNWSIWRVAADGSSAVSMTTDPGDEVSPTWAPDGTAFAFAGSDVPHSAGAHAEKAFEIFVMEADGSGRRKLTTGAEARAGWLSWQAVPG